MTDKKSNDSRRKLLKSIAAGSGAVVAGKTLPEAWTKPIVDSVMLPAHAATTGDGQFFADITNYAPLEATKALLCVTVTGNNYVGMLAMTFGQEGTDIFTSPSTPIGTASTMTGTCIEGGYFQAANMSAGSIDYRFGGDEPFLSLPLASCNLPAADCIPLDIPAALEGKAENAGW